MRNWYVIQIVPQQQKTAEFNLHQQNYSYFFPTLATKVNAKGTVVETIPLFKGYGFVQLNLETDHWIPIKSTRGVIRLLPKSSLIPQPIDTAFVDFLLNNSPLIEPKKLTAVLQNYVPGTKVQITNGVLQGYYGTILIQRGRLFEVLLKTKDHQRNPLIAAENLTLI